jgi:hypothetical protein
MKARTWGTSRWIQVRQSKLYAIISLTTCNHTTIKDRSWPPPQASFRKEFIFLWWCDVELENRRTWKQLSSKREGSPKFKIALQVHTIPPNGGEREKQYPNIEWFWTNLLKPWSRSMTIHYGELIPTSSNHFA